MRANLPSCDLSCAVETSPLPLPNRITQHLIVQRYISSQCSHADLSVMYLLYIALYGFDYQAWLY